MKLSSRRTALLIVLCVTLLAVRATGVHLHLCLDGKETPQALHWSDAVLHGDEDHASGAHSDLDLNLSADALIKGVKLGFDLPILLFAALGLFALFVARNPLPLAEQQQLSYSASPRYFQPPLRAPPL